MKRTGMLLAVLAVMIMSVSAFADDAKPMKMNKMTKGDETSKTMSVTGEIVDMGCYLGHGARGADHKSCALKCIANGMPMGLLTNDGTLYLLTMSHENADPFNKAKDMAAETVTVTGPVFERNGEKGIEVTEVAKADGAKSEKTQ